MYIFCLLINHLLDMCFIQAYLFLITYHSRYIWIVHDDSPKFTSQNSTSIKILMIILHFFNIATTNRRNNWPVALATKIWELSLFKALAISVPNMNSFITTSNMFKYEFLNKMK